MIEQLVVVLLLSTASQPAAHAQDGKPNAASVGPADVDSALLDELDAGAAPRRHAYFLDATKLEERAARDHLLATMLTAIGCAAVGCFAPAAIVSVVPISILFATTITPVVTFVFLAIMTGTATATFSLGAAIGAGLLVEANSLHVRGLATDEQLDVMTY